MISEFSSHRRSLPSRGSRWAIWASSLRAELALYRLDARSGTSRGALSTALVCQWNCSLSRNLHRALPRTHHARILAQRPKFRSISKSESNRIFFALAAILILACAQDNLRKRRNRWIVWVLALVLIGAAIILNFSLSGVAILMAGSAFWLGTQAFRQRSRWRLALGVSLSLLLLLLTAVLLSAGKHSREFVFHDFSSADISSNLRWQIFHETLRLIRNSPWCGIGFGNFEPIFAMFREASLGGARALHPESDWLWLWTELGWPALVLIILGITLLARRAFPLRTGTNQGYRLAALIAALLFAIDGIVDVPGHQMGTAFAAVFLLGLSVHRPLSLKKEPVDVDLISFCRVGIACRRFVGSWRPRWETPSRLSWCCQREAIVRRGGYRTQL